MLGGRFFRVSSGVLCLFLVGYFRTGSAAVATTINFVSDQTWTSFAMNPDGSIGTSLGLAQFVCASCQPSFCPSGATVFNHPYCIWGANLSSIPGAAWTWRPGVTGSTTPADLQGAYFSKDFDLPGAPISGTILVAVDDFAEVSINGTVVGSTGSITDIGLAAGAQSALKPFDLTPFLRAGLNTVTIRAQNGPASFTGYRCNPCDYSGNPAGVVFGGVLTYETVPQPQTCATVLAAFTAGSIDVGGGVVVDTAQCAAAPAGCGWNCVLGPPDRQFTSIGELGSVTVHFTDAVILDAPGDDIIIWGSCNARYEPGRVLASADGETFVPLGTFDAGVSMDFDLAGSGLAQASFIRVEDLPGGVLPGGSGVDIDAICAYHVGMPVASHRESWGSIKVRYR